MTILQKDLKRLLRKNDGFIAIIALGIFVLLGTFGIIIQETMIDTVGNIKDTNNYYMARDIADSATEALRYELRQHESGYSTEAVCLPADFANAQNSRDGTTGKHEFCDSLVSFIGDNEVTVSLKIKGRASDVSGEEEKLGGSCPGFGAGSSGCYVTPFPGTGDAV